MLRRRRSNASSTRRASWKPILADDSRDIDDRWTPRISNISVLKVGLERTDVKVTHLVLAWVPVA